MTIAARAAAPERSRPALTAPIELTELALRVGLFAGHYLEDYELAKAVLDDVFDSWQTHTTVTTPVGIQDWWDQYVDRIESSVGGYDRCDDEELEKTWLTHARQLLARPR